MNAQQPIPSRRLSGLGCRSCPLWRGRGVCSTSRPSSSHFRCLDERRQAHVVFAAEIQTKERAKAIRHYVTSRRVSIPGASDVYVTQATSRRPCISYGRRAKLPAGPSGSSGSATCRGSLPLPAKRNQRQRYLRAGPSLQSRPSPSSTHTSPFTRPLLHYNCEWTPLSPFPVQPGLTKCMGPLD